MDAERAWLPVTLTLVVWSGLAGVGVLQLAPRMQRPNHAQRGAVPSACEAYAATTAISIASALIPSHPTHTHSAGSQPNRS
jgi:hypothetical protein